MIYFRGAIWHIYGEVICKSCHGYGWGRQEAWKASRCCGALNANKIQWKNTNVSVITYLLWGIHLVGSCVLWEPFFLLRYIISRHRSEACVHGRSRCKFYIAILHQVNSAERQLVVFFSESTKKIPAKAREGQTNKVKQYWQSTDEVIKQT